MLRFFGPLLVGVLFPLAAVEPDPIALQCQLTIASYLPYNPVIVDIGAGDGLNTAYFAKRWPKGKTVVFEPNPSAFTELQKNLEPFSNVVYCNEAVNLYNGQAQLHLSPEGTASLLEKSPHGENHPEESTQIVPCVVLDDWCQAHGVSRIEALHIDAEGFELEILKSSPEIFKTVLVIWIKTHHSKSRIGIGLYPEMKLFLEAQGFTEHLHWVDEEGQGDALFIRSYIYDAVYN